MGNLISSKTDEELRNLENRIKRDKELGKPDDPFLGCSVDQFNLGELKMLKRALSPFYDNWELSNLIKWIEYKKKLI